jgi:hypothetical protein
MTWSRYFAIYRSREQSPPAKHLLMYVAAAHGYKPTIRPKSAQETAQELKQMFPSGVIKSAPTRL